MSEIDDAQTEDELDPNLKPKSAKAWLAAIKQAEDAFADYQERADRIDKVYADLKQLASQSRDREFQMFWANIEVLKPAIYSRPPVPVCTPRFKDRRPVPRVASEMLERSTTVAFELGQIDETMRLARDDLAIQSRGVIWVRYETKKESDRDIEQVCIEQKDRKDFLHEPARNWQAVGWVAAASHLTRKGMKKRFFKTSGNAYQNATYTIRKDDRDNGASDDIATAKVWEVWSKTLNRCVWVTEGVDVLLDDGEPHLKLEGFYPCPRPAYGTLQRRSLIPVPDMLFYKDQLEEINTLTGRIAALSEAVQVRGFYPAGQADVGDQIEQAIKTRDPRQVMIGVANWAAFGTGSAKDTIVWLPTDMIVSTIRDLVELRRQMIDDVYQITGLSDIMRGTTDPKETLGAQQLKSQYGSIRIRDRQAELVRLARDVARIAAEIMAENFSSETLLDMSQMELPTDAEIKKQIGALKQQGEQIVRQADMAVAQIKNNPQIMAQAQQNPEQAQQMMQQAQEQVQQQLDGLGKQAEELQQQTTIEQVMKLLRSQKLRPFVLDIETDSTIQPDEDAEKQRRAEFLTAMGTVMQQLAPMVAERPETAAFAGEVLKFAVAPFRVGREMDTAIDEFVDQMKAQAGQPRPNPEAEKAKADQEMADRQQQADLAKQKQDGEIKLKELQYKDECEQRKADNDIRMKGMEFGLRKQENDAKLAQIAAQDRRDAEKHAREMEKINADIEMKRLDGALAVQGAQIDAAKAESAEAREDRQFEQTMAQSDRAFEQKTSLNAQAARQQALKASQQPGASK